MTVYFVTTGDPGAPVKIGFTDRPVMERLRALQTGCAEPLVLTLVLPGAGRHVETALHEQFAAEHIRGEWFRRSENLVSWVESARSAPGSVVAGEPPAAPFPWARVVCAALVFLACCLLGPLGVALGIGAAIGILAPAPPAFSLGVVAGLTRSRLLMLAAVVAGRRGRLQFKPGDSRKRLGLSKQP